MAGRNQKQACASLGECRQFDQKAAGNAAKGRSTAKEPKESKGPQAEGCVPCARQEVCVSHPQKWAPGQYPHPCWWNCRGTWNFQVWVRCAACVHAVCLRVLRVSSAREEVRLTAHTRAGVTAAASSSAGVSSAGLSAAISCTAGSAGLSAAASSTAGSAAGISHAFHCWCLVCSSRVASRICLQAELTQAQASGEFTRPFALEKKDGQMVSPFSIVKRSNNEEASVGAG